MGLLLAAVNRGTVAASFNPVRALGNTAPINQRELYRCRDIAIIMKDYVRP
jgi:hypothetical protein